MARTGDPFVLEFMGEVNRLQGTIRGGQFHVGAHRWPLGYTPAYQGPVDLFCALGKWISAAVPASIRRCRYRYWKPAQRSLHPISGAAAGVVQRTADGRDAWRRCPAAWRAFIRWSAGARLYNGDERIETRDEELALAQSA